MKKLNMGIIGGGMWGANHAKVFNTLAETSVVAVCDISPERAAAFAKQSGCPTAYTTIDALIADPRVEAISIATPDFTHAPIILAALKASKHVLCEKPLAMTLEETEEVHRMASRSSAKLMVDFHNRVNPAIVQMQECVASQEIGKPVHGYARLSNTSYVPLEMLSWAERSSALWFLGSHVVDALRFILNDEVKRVYSVARDGVLKARGVDTKDVHISILEFSNGTVITLENSWILSPSNPIPYDFRIELVGENGQISANPSHNGGLTRLTSAGMKFGDLCGITPTGPSRVGGFVLEAIAQFVDAVLHDTPLLADANDGLAATRVLAAIERSAKCGTPVEL